MAEYSVEAGQVGVYGKALVAKTVDAVLFKEAVPAVEIIGDGSAAIYVTFDGSAPTVGGADCYELPAFPSVRVIDVSSGSGSLNQRVVKLISEGTPTYSVSQAAGSRT